MSTINADEFEIPRTNRWAFLVGINQYAHIPSLRYCANDAEELHDLLISTPDSGYVSERVRKRLIRKSQDSADPIMSRTILRQLQQLSAQTQPEDMLLFYFAGHGYVTEQDGRGETFLLTTESEPGVLLPELSIRLGSVIRILDACPARSKVIILDACYSGVPLSYGVSRRSTASDGPDSKMMEELLSEAEGLAILSSAARSEQAFESEEFGHGVFTHFLLKGLSGGANPRPDGSITTSEIHQYVSSRIRGWAKKHGKSVRPTMEFRGAGELTLITTPIASTPSNNSPVELPVSHSFPSGFSPDAWLTPLRTSWSGWIERKAAQQVRDGITSAAEKAIQIKGHPGTGKTSLLNRIRYEIESGMMDSSLHFKIISIPIDPHTTEERFAAELWDGLARCIDPDHTQLTPETFEAGKYTSANAFIAMLMAKIKPLAPNTTFIVLLDELDRIAVKRDDSDHQLTRIAFLIKHLIESNDLPILFLYTVVADLLMQSSYPSDPFTVEPRKLLLFDQAATSTLVQELLNPFVQPTSAELDWIYAYTGGHPYLTRLLIAKLFEPGPWPQFEEGIGQERLEQSAHAAMSGERANRLLRGIYTILFDDPQRTILLQFAYGNREQISLDEIERGLHSAVKELAAKEYLTEVKPKIYIPRIRFIIDWLRQWSQFSSEVDRLKIAGDKHIGQDGIFIDTVLQRIYVEGKEIPPLPDLQYRTLVFLAERVGQVVTYDELAEHLHPEEFHDLDEGMDNTRITVQIHRLRSALGDQKPYKYLQTMHKRGYRLMNATLR